MEEADRVTDVPIVTPFTNTYSMSFDGVDEYMNVADNDNLSFGNGTTDSPFSISAWVKMNDATRFRIVGKYDSNLEYLFSTGGTDKIVFNCYDNSTGGRIGRQYSTALTSFEGQWIHLVATYNGSSSSSGLKIYLNGSRVDDTDSNSGTYTAMENTTAPLEIGKNLTTYANGLIDETAIFNSELSASDVTAIYNSGVPTDLTSLSPLSWWRMGDGDTWNGSTWTLTDNGSGGNDATSVNMEEGDRVTDVPPNFNLYSMSFDGVDEYFNVGNVSNLNFERTDAFSISVWFKKPSSGSAEFIIGKNENDTPRSGYFAFTSGNLVHFRLTTSGGNNIQIRHDSTHNLNVWEHYVFTYDGSSASSGLNMYQNGTLLTNVTRGGSNLTQTIQTSIPFTIASRQGLGLFLNGKIDEASVFNTELSQSDVTTIFNNGTPNDISSLSPISWWRMGEEASWNGSQWTLTDQGSGGNNATSVNMEEGDRTTDKP